MPVVLAVTPPGPPLLTSKDPSGSELTCDWQPEAAGAHAGAGCWTVRVWDISGAAAKPAFPAWSASITHEPSLANVTVDPRREQVSGVLVASMEKTTGLPESPPVADT